MMAQHVMVPTTKHDNLSSFDPQNPYSGRKEPSQQIVLWLLQAGCVLHSVHSLLQHKYINIKKEKNL